MSKNQKKLYIILPIIFIFLVFFIVYKFSKHADQSDVISTTPNAQIETSIKSVSPTKEETQTAKPLTQKIKETTNTENAESVTVLSGETTTHLFFSQNTSFYDALVKARSEGKIEFSGKNYPGLGFFVTDIQTLHSGSGRHLFYYINGKEATVGVSSYTLKDGDIIEWKLK